MIPPRRRLVRPTTPPPGRPSAERLRQQLRTRLEAERAALTRWMSRLRRAFHAVEKGQRRLARLERRLAQWKE
jgi:hypothetical protein